MNALSYYNNGNTLDYNDGSTNVIKIVWENGTEEHYSNGVLHRDGGLPAIVHADGSREYWENGQRRQRVNGTSIEWADGTVEYFE